MLYKPNYCCQCGEKIERSDWFLWTSRSFCEVCETEFKIREKIPLFIVVFGVFVSLFGIGAYLKSGENQSPLVVRQIRAENIKPNPVQANQQIVPETPVNNQNSAQKEAKRVSAENKTIPASETINDRVVQIRDEPGKAAYYCGAETKKGTPCSRRVKGGGRCFQHKGQAAMLPPEKLVVSGN